MSEIIFRQLQEKDAEAYQSIRLEMLKNSPEAFGGSYEENLEYGLDFFINNILNSCVFGAFFENQLIGTAGSFIQKGKKSEHKAFLWGVYVNQTYRGKGISYQLTNKVIDNLSPEISLIQTAVVQGNIAALKIYEKAGFKRWGVEEKGLKIQGIYYDEIHMVKFLDKS